jgi:hypothetical protein
VTQFPYAALAARFTDPFDRDRFATVALGQRLNNPQRAFDVVARQIRSPATQG